jgi:hypothetical protein
MNPESNPNRALALWFGAFVSTGILLYFYGHIPPGPILIGGGLAFIVTVIGIRRNRRR